MGQLERAHGTYRKVLQLIPEDPTVLNNMGLMYLESGRLDAAQSYLSQSLKIEGASPEIDYTLDFTDLLVEGIDNSWTLEITNEGEKYGEISTTLYWDENDEDNIIEIIPQTKVDVDETKAFEGDITPSDQVEKLYIPFISKSTSFPLEILIKSSTL